VSRYAGDEFVLVWPSIKTHDEAAHLAERLTESLTAPFELESATVTVTASIGVVLGFPPQAADDLLLNADAAMYDAKSRGRGRTRMYTDEMREGVAARLRTEAELREALDRGEFVLHYQPVIDLRARAVTGVEALVRWQHPDGLRMPDSFIPVAEATGLIVPLGTWVLEEACRQGAEWSAQGLELEMAVNFSARQIGHPDIIPSIRRALQRSQMRPERLIAEVTESSVVEDAEIAQLAFAQIREIGAAVAIDDFGTGYSSLLYLKRYPITALKVDRQFVAGMSTNDDDYAIVASVVSLARAVGAFCIAEGVETLEQYGALAQLGCEYAQGYLFGRPVPAGDLARVMRDCATLLELPTPRSASWPPDSAASLAALPKGA
jgi:EAL domain-containing protein (putative c-di-GMP-specific phosphodiesterase class I)